MSDYTEQVEDFRQRKDAHFAAGKGPLDPSVLSQFTGLSYYPPDISWRFLLPLEPVQSAAPEVEFQTSSGEPRFMTKLGEVALPFPDHEHRLSVFAPLGEDAPARAFIPFRDQTSGGETYGAGRYLDAPIHRDGVEVWVEVDFNLAYHPYCAYGDGWTCPLPPAENVLPLAVRAGERLPVSSH